jgi:hypothetical protein
VGLKKSAVPNLKPRVLAMQLEVEETVFACLIKNISSALSPSGLTIINERHNPLSDTVSPPIF